MDFIKEFFFGLYDSFQIFTILPLIYRSTKNFNNIRNCLAFNGVMFLGSIFVYFKFIEPVVVSILSYHSISRLLFLINYIYYILWLVPMFIVCNVLTGFWVNEIYEESLKIIEGKSPTIEGQNFLIGLSNNIERLFIVIGFVLQNTLLNLIPLPGIFILKWISFSILNSLYVFEYILLQKYLCSYKSILIFAENKFFYFLGYGCLLTVLLNMVDSLTINTSIFLMAFPFFLVASLKVNNDRFKDVSGLSNKNTLIFFFFISSVYSILKNSVMKLHNKNYNIQEKKTDNSSPLESETNKKNS